MSDKVRPNGWADLSTVTAGEFEELDNNTAAAISGTIGDAYAPEDPIVIGGGGILDANAEELDCGDSEIGNKNFNNITANRVNVVNAGNVTNRITLNIGSTPAVGTKWEATFSVIIELTTVQINDSSSNVVIEYTAVKQLSRLKIELEMRDSGWVVSHIGSDGNDLPNALKLVSSVLPDPNDYYDVRKDEYYVTGNLNSEKWFRLNPDAADGKVHSIFFETLGAGANVQFRSPINTILHSYKVNGAGEKNVYFRFVKVNIDASSSTWKLLELTKHSKPNQTLVTEKSDGKVNVNLNLYSRVLVTSAIDAGNDLTFNMTGDYEEGTEITFYVKPLSNPLVVTKLRWDYEDTQVYDKSLGGENVAPTAYPSGLSVPLGGSIQSYNVTFDTFAEWYGYSLRYIAIKLIVLNNTWYATVQS